MIDVLFTSLQCLLILFQVVVIFIIEISSVFLAMSLKLF